MVGPRQHLCTPGILALVLGDAMDLFGEAVLLVNSIGALIVSLIIWKHAIHGLVRPLLFRAFARRNHFAVSKGDDKALRKRLSHFELFWRGSDNRTASVLRGCIDGQNLTVFDYATDVLSRSRLGARRRWKTVVLVESGDLKLPQFSLRPAHLRERRRQFRHLDIEFPSNPTFVQRYALQAQGKDEEEVRGLFSPEMLEHLSNISHGEEVCIEGGRTQLILYKPSRGAFYPAARVPIHNLRFFVEMAVRTLGHFGTFDDQPDQ